MRQAGANGVEPVVAIGDQLRLAGVGVGIELALVTIEGVDALPDRALGQPLFGQERLQPRLDRLGLIEAELVHLLRRHGGGRAGPERGPIEALSILELPAPRVVGGGRP